MRIIEHAQRGRIRHVRMQRTSRLPRQPVHRKMNVQRRILDETPAAHDASREIEHHEIAGFDLGPQQAKRRQQKAIVKSRNHQREVIVDAFIQAEMGGQAITRREVHPSRTLGECLIGVGFKIGVQRKEYSPRESRYPIPHDGPTPLRALLLLAHLGYLSRARGVQFERRRSAGTQC